MANQPGLALADLAPITEDVPVGTSHLSIRGLAAKDLINILRRFPSVTKMITGGGFNISELLTIAPDAVAAIITYATTTTDDQREAAEANAAALPIETQLDIAEAIGRLTFKSGFGPFVKRLLDAANAVKSDLSTKVPGLNSQPPLKPSSPPATPQT